MEKHIVISLILSACLIFSAYLFRSKDKEFLLFLTLIFFCGFNADIPVIEMERKSAGVRPGTIMLIDFVIVSIIFIHLSNFLQKNRFIYEHHKKSIIDKVSLMKVILICFILWQGLSLIIKSDNIGLGFFFWIQMLRGVTICFIAVRSIKNDSNIDSAVMMLVAISLINGFFALLQHLNGGSLGLYILGESSREGIREFQVNNMYIRSYVSGFIGLPYRLGAFLSLTAPLTLGLIYYNKINSFFIKITLIISFLANTLTTFLSFSRTAWVTYTAGCILSIFYFLTRSSTIDTRKKSAYIIVGFVFAICLVALNFETILSRFMKSNFDQSLVGRLSMIDVSIEIISKNPILGLGLGSVADRVGYLIHNLYLLIACQSGVIALFLFIALILMILMMTKSVCFSKINNYSVSFRTFGLFAGLLGLLTHSIVTWLFWSPPINNTFFLFLGIISAAYRISKEQE